MQTRRERKSLDLRVLSPSGASTMGSPWPLEKQIAPNLPFFWCVEDKMRLTKDKTALPANPFNLANSSEIAHHIPKCATIHPSSFLLHPFLSRHAGNREKGVRHKRRSQAAWSSQNCSNRPERIQQRRAMMALAPLTDQNMPERLSREPTTVRHPASITPEPMK